MQFGSLFLATVYSRIKFIFFLSLSLVAKQIHIQLQEKSKWTNVNFLICGKNLVMKLHLIFTNVTNINKQ